jgi:hypothetical protein
MAIGALILGDSGTGKTFSIHTFDPEEVKILSVRKPILPFRGKYDVVKTPTAEDVVRELKNCKKKCIVVDDFQYILGIPMMQRIGEKGWDKFNEISAGYSEVLDTINALPDDVIVFLNSHVMYNDDTGRVQIKTIGKALDKYLTVEGLFMIVLGTQVVDGKYYFITQNNGSNTLKSPDGMFPSVAIPNDLKYVTEKIRNYYYLDGAKSDSEIAAEDAEHTVSEEEVKSRRGRRNRTETPAETSTEETTERTRRHAQIDEKIEAEKVEMEKTQEKIDEALDEKFPDQEEIPWEEASEVADQIKEELPHRKEREESTNEETTEPVAEATEETPRRRRRRV